MRLIMLTAKAGLLVVALMAVAAATGKDVRAGEATVEVGSNYFCNPSFYTHVCETTINAGDTVVWSFVSGIHTTTECGGDLALCKAPHLWDSGAKSAGMTFSFTLDTPGTYLYHCEVHPSQMKGQITVLAPPPTPSPTETPTTASSPTPPGSPIPAPSTSVAGEASPVANVAPVSVPRTGGAPGEAGLGAPWSMLLTLTSALLLIGSVCCFLRAKRRPWHL